MKAILHDLAFLIHSPTLPDRFFGTPTTTAPVSMLVCKMVMQKLIIIKNDKRERGAKENHKSFFLSCFAAKVIGFRF